MLTPAFACLCFPWCIFMWWCSFSSFFFFVKHSSVGICEEFLKIEQILEMDLDFLLLEKFFCFCFCFLLLAIFKSGTTQTAKNLFEVHVLVGML